MADNQISRRAKDNFPTVLLTLLSIVQALALELMWSHLSEQDYLYQWSFIAILSWLQIAATLLGILLIWMIYSSLVMRFRWVPTTTDAIFPFIVGIVEFAQINSMGPTNIGLWFAITGVLFLSMGWISQITMRRSRLDGDNDEFFENIEPATRRDYVMSILPALALGATGALLWQSGNQGWMALIAIVGVLALLIRQVWMTHVFTERSYARD